MSDFLRADGLKAMVYESIDHGELLSRRQNPFWNSYYRYYMIMDTICCNSFGRVHSSGLGLQLWFEVLFGSENKRVQGG